MAAASKTPHPLAELYGLWALNPLVEVARVLSFDVAVRPQNYRALDPKTAETLAGFRFKVGADPLWPDTFQRTLNFKPLYQVALATPPLREAALRYLEAPSDAMREAFRTVATSCRAQLEPLEGHGLSLTVDQSRAIFARAISLLQDPAIAHVFAPVAVPASGWPFDGNIHGDAANLVAHIVRGLAVVFCLGGSYKRLSKATPTATRPLVPPLTVTLPQDKFLRLQRAAYHGRSTLSLVLASGGDLGSDELIASAYQWTKALQVLVPDVERAWRDVDYRCTLSDLEWGMAPNPSGEMTPATAGAALAFSTSTVHGEICCCSGDLDCDPTSQLSDFCSEYQCPAA
ncbi:MAG: hypothetical protein ABI467_04315 [Kofleriaceae bacterium]